MIAALVLCGLLQAESAAELLRRFEETHVFWQQLDIAEKLAARREGSVLPGLESWLQHDDRHLRGNAALVFAALGESRGFDIITGMLRDESSRGPGQGVASARPGWSLQQQIDADRYYAVHLLGVLKDARAVPILEPLLEDARLNYKVPWSLGQIGGAEAIRVLLKALRHESVDVRVGGIYAVQELKAKEAVPVLRTLLDDRARNRLGQPTTVAEAARAAIAKLER
jgi:HEAT repeat protein